jgi:outer membrane murein-binding lipoprotein Lpp
VTIEQFILAAVIGIAGAGGAALISAFASKRWGTGTLAKEVDEQEGKLIVTLQGQITAAERSAAQANDRAEAAEKKADGTEARRQACETEIDRLKRALTLTEGELLDLYRRTGTVAPRGLISRHADHKREDSQ